MKISSYGYKEAKVELREMTISEMKLSIIESYVNGGVKPVVLMDISSGDTVEFNSIEDVTRNSWSGNCKIEIINKPHAWGDDTTHKIIIMFQIMEDETDRII